MSILLLLCPVPMDAAAAQQDGELVILYENDAHCAVEGYSKLAALKNRLQSRYAHVSGVTFCVNTAIPSSVTLDAEESFTGVSGEYRVYDIQVRNGQTGLYEPLDLQKVYTLGASSHYLLAYGRAPRLPEVRRKTAGRTGNTPCIFTAICVILSMIFAAACRDHKGVHL